MSEELNITIREAIPDDAAQLLTVMRQIGQETEFLVRMKPVSSCRKNYWHSSWPIFTIVLLTCCF